MKKIKHSVLPLFLGGLILCGLFWPDANGEKIEREIIAPYSNIKKPPLKAPTKQAAVLSLLQPLTQRVWLSKYYGVPSEIYGYYSETPFCSEWPKDIQRHPHEPNEDRVSIWLHKCLPVSVEIIKNDENTDGTLIIKMLGSNLAKSVLDDVTNILNKNNLTPYRIKEEDFDTLKQVIKNKLGQGAVYNKFMTYYSLEKYYFSKEVSPENDKGEDTIASTWPKKTSYSLINNIIRSEANKDTTIFTINAPILFD